MLLRFLIIDSHSICKDVPNSKVKILGLKVVFCESLYRNLYISDGFSYKYFPTSPLF